jgi:sugar/nucleoside kinase (ribokinase family)
MTEASDAVVSGHICLDLIPDLSTLPRQELGTLMRPGRLLEVGPLTFSTGGAVSNTGLSLSRLGISTRLMGKIGDDLLGQVVRQVVASYGEELVAGMIVDERVDTSYTVIISPPGVDRIFLHCPGANDTFEAQDVRYDVVERTRLFHFGYPPLMRRMYSGGGDEVTTILRRVKEMGVTTSLDMALPDPASAAGRADWAAILRQCLPYTDIFLPSIEETIFMLRRDLYDRLLDQAPDGDILPLVTPELLSDVATQLIALGVKIAGLKLGDRGFYLRTAGEAAMVDLGRARPDDWQGWAGHEFWSACYQVDMVGTTGAGDATIAGFLAGFLRGLSPVDALTAAVAVGGCNVEAADALSGVRPWDETWTRVEAGWPRHGLLLEADGWRYDEGQQVWIGPAD